MRDLARVGAFVAAAVVLGRNLAISGGGSGMLGAATFALVLVLLALTLWRDGLVTGSALALGGHYVAALAYGDVAIDLAAPVVGALLLAYLDLADLAASVPRDRRVDGRLAVATLRRTGTLLAVATGAGVAVLAVAAVPLPGGEWLRAAGAFGVAAVVIVPLILLRRAQ